MDPFLGVNAYIEYLLREVKVTTMKPKDHITADCAGHWGSSLQTQKLGGIIVWRAISKCGPILNMFG